MTPYLHNQIVKRLEKIAGNLSFIGLMLLVIAINSCVGRVDERDSEQRGV